MSEAGSTTPPGSHQHIRLRYSGLLLFGGKIAAIATGLAFSALVARTLPKSDLGVWFFISGTLMFFLFIQNVVPFWGLREAARGQPAGKTSVMTNIILSIPFFVAFLVAAPFLAASVTFEPLVFYVAAALIPLQYFISSLNALITARSPHKLAPFDIIVDVAKLSVLFALLPLGLLGVVIAVIIGYGSYSLYAFWQTRHILLEKISVRYVKRWIRLSWITVYGALGNSLFGATDKFVLGILGMLAGLGSYGVALTITSLVRLTATLSSALYPKTLRKGVAEERDIREMLTFTLMFALPMVTGIFLMGPNLISIFGSKYIDGLTALYVLTPAVLFGVLGDFADYVIIGEERIDTGGTPSVGRALKSNLFKVNTLNFLAFGVTLSLMLILIPSIGVTGTAVAVLVAHAIVFGLKAPMAFKGRSILDVKRVSKIVAAVTAMSIPPLVIPYVGTIQSLMMIALAAVVYFSCLLALDRRTRELLQLIIKEIMA